MSIILSPVIHRDLKVTTRSTNQRYFSRRPMIVDPRNTLTDTTFGVPLLSGNSFYTTQESPRLARKSRKLKYPTKISFEKKPLDL